MKKEYKTKWGKKLREARMDMELTLAEATKLLFEGHGVKLDPAQLARVERGESDCAVNKFKALCQVYEISPAWVLDLEAKKK